MAEIAPFCGLRYNTEKLENLATVVIPPYDVISPEEQELFHHISPYNMVHLELGRTLTAGYRTRQCPHACGKDFRKWQQEQILIS